MSITENEAQALDSLTGSTLKRASLVDSMPLPEICKLQPNSEVPRPEARVLCEQNLPCVVTIGGKGYDLTKWADRHPGGPVIRQYHGLEATHIFDAFHGPQAKKLLNSFPALDAKQTKALVESYPVVHASASTRAAQEAYGTAEDDARSQELLRNFEGLVKEVQEAGLFKVNVPWMIYKVITTLMFFPISIYLHWNGWFYLSALIAGVGWQQLGWLGHDFCHHTVFNNRKYNQWVGFFLGNFMQGFSQTWWKDRHNSHHATTNVLDMDPDIDNIPTLAWSPSDLDRAPEWCKKIIPYQAKYFLFILPLLRLAWCSESVKFVRMMNTTVYKAYQDLYPVEAVTLAMHYVWTSLVYYIWMPSFGAFVVWYLIAHLLAGFGIAIVVFFNHYSCEKFDAVLAGNFVCLQLYTTRNMSPGPIIDWICGGLNYQVEHHLFPTMPRHNLTKCSALVKRFCEKNKLPYMSCGFVEGTQYVLAFLQQIADLAVERQKAEAALAKKLQ